MKTFLIPSALLSYINTHTTTQVNVPPELGRSKPCQGMKINYSASFFKGKQFNIYDQPSQLLCSNARTFKDGKVSGLPGFSNQAACKGNMLPPGSNNEYSAAGYTASFAGKNVVLKPIIAKCILNQPLVLKETIKQHE